MMLQRLGRLVRGDFGVFEEIAADPRSTVEALMLSAIGPAIGVSTTARTWNALALGAVAGIVGLVGWAAVLWVGGRVAGGRATYAGLVRTVGYTAPPFAFIAIPLVVVVATIGIIALQVVVVRRIHGITAGWALSSVVVPWIPLLMFGAAIR